jgi:hypothetical protein
MKSDIRRVRFDHVGVPRTFSTTVWTFFKCYLAASFPRLSYFLVQSKRFRLVAKLVKLISFVRRLEPLLARRTCTLFLLLNSFTFLDDPDRYAIQKLAFVQVQFLATFGTLFPFSAADLGNCEHCYSQLSFAAAEISELQALTIREASAFIPALRPATLPLSHLMPAMSLSRVRIGAFLQAVPLLDPREAEKQLRGLFAGPIVQFVSDGQDFLGLSEADWRIGLDRCAGPFPPSGHCEYQGPIERRFALFAVLVRVFDRDSRDPARLFRTADDRVFDSAFEGRPPKITAADAQDRWFALLPERVRAGVAVVEENRAGSLWKSLARAT